METEIKQNELYFDGCSTSSLAKEYGTPLYVISKSEILKRCDELKTSFINKYENVRVAYAAKAFLTYSMAKLINEQGMYIDVVSGGELFTALTAGFPAEKVEFNGNNKLEEELRYAIEEGVGRIIVDGLDELDIIEDIAGELNKTVKVLYRITPSVESDTHDFMNTGVKDSKFGFPMDDTVILPAVEKAVKSDKVEFMGFHFHVGSQIFENTSYVKALRNILQLVEKTKEEFDYVVKEINLGGGFGAVYTDEVRKPYSYYLDPLMEEIYSFYDKHEFVRPAVIIEPGRSIVAEAGITMYKVGTIKEIEGIRKYVSVDGGMADNIRPALYDAKYNAVVANNVSSDQKEVVTICGKCCESGDILVKDIELPVVKRGDYIAVQSTGAYGYSMASNYNKLPKPAVVEVYQGKARLVVKRETYLDINKNEIL